MDVSEHVRFIWDSLLTINETKLKRDCDNDVQGILLLLQVFTSQIKSFVNRCVNAEKSLDVALQRCSCVEAKCFELQSAIEREKSKVCSECSNLQQRLELQKKSLEEKTKPCFLCPKLRERIRRQQLKIDDGKAKLETVVQILKPSAVPKEKRRSTAYDAVSQMLDGFCEPDFLDENSISEREAIPDTSKRKSEELDADGPKRKSPCIDKASMVSPILQNLPVKQENIIEVPETKVKLVQNEQFNVEKSERILVPETLDDEYFNHANSSQGIIIPETCYTQGDFLNFHLDNEKSCETTSKEETDGKGDTSPILNASISKKSENPTSLSSKSLSKGKNTSISPANAKEKNCPQNDAFQILGEIFDEIDGKTATSVKLMKATVGNSKEDKGKKVLASKNNLSSEYKRADFRKKEKNLWLLKKSENNENEPQSEDSIIKKMKQTTLNVISVPKKQDISANENFCGGVLSGPLEIEDENMDSDDSECLVLPSPKNSLNNTTSKSSSLNKSKPDEMEKNCQSISIVPKTGPSFPSLDDTYFAPPITSTCFSGLSKIKNEEEDDVKAASEVFKKQIMETSFDKVPNRTPKSPGFKYKEAPVRKKNERQQLPGWDCEDCKKYYMFAGRNGEDPQEHKNKCSRHRSKYRDVNKTVEGFWDPWIPDTQDET